MLLQRYDYDASDDVSSECWLACAMQSLVPATELISKLGTSIKFLNDEEAKPTLDALIDKVIMKEALFYCIRDYGFKGCPEYLIGKAKDVNLESDFPLMTYDFHKYWFHSIEGEAKASLNNEKMYFTLIKDCLYAKGVDKGYKLINDHYTRYVELIKARSRSAIVTIRKKALEND